MENLLVWITWFNHKMGAPLAQLPPCFQTMMKPGYGSYQISRSNHSAPKTSEDRNRKAIPPNFPLILSSPGSLISSPPHTHTQKCQSLLVKSHPDWRILNQTKPISSPGREVRGEPAAHLGVLSNYLISPVVPFFLSA